MAEQARLKKCSRCKRDLPVTAFHRRRHHVKGGVRAACRECTSAATAARPQPASDDKRRKDAVRARTRRLIKTGKLTPQTCRVCGDPDVQAHHTTYDGDEAARIVEWYCHLHHAGHHGVRDWTKQIDLPLKGGSP